jgi:hypothetical protein
MEPTFVTQLIYLVVSVVLTVWVARTLFHHGQAFLADVFRGNPVLAGAVNSLLVVGFYLLNLGFVCVYLAQGIEAHRATESVTALASKIGVVLLVLGGMHFLNLIILHAMRRHALEESAQPPVAPDTPPAAAASRPVPSAP